MKEQLKAEFVKLQTLNIDYKISTNIHNCSSDYFPNYIVNFTVDDKHIAIFSRIGTSYSSSNRYDEFFKKQPQKYTREFNYHEGTSFTKNLELLKQKIVNFSTPSENEMIK